MRREIRAGGNGGSSEKLRELRARALRWVDGGSLSRWSVKHVSVSGTCALGNNCMPRMKLLEIGVANRQEC